MPQPTNPSPSARICLGLLCSALALTGADWPQFRGPGASGVGDDKANLPAEFGPAKSLLWKTPLPKGHGSPCVLGNRIFVTAFDPAANTLHVIAVNRVDGKVVWRDKVPATEIEKVHPISSPANSTPVTDGERIYAYFGSYGLIAYDLNGKVVWEHPMPLSTMNYGAGTSPVLAGDVILITRDYLPKPVMTAINRKDGKLAWNVDLDPLRFAGSAAHSTPLVLGDQVILNRPTRVSGHSLKDGSLVWWVNTTSAGDSTLTTSGGLVFVTAFNMGADPAGAVEKVPFSVALEKYDKNKDGKLSKDEVPDNDLYFLRRVGVGDEVPGAHFTIKLFFDLIDQNKDGFVDETEYNGVFKNFGRTGENNGLMAIRPGGQGDMSGSAIVWKERRSVPEIPAPLAYRGRVYMIANGGVLTCVDEKSGKLIYRGRINAPGAYYASPVAAGGKIIVANSDGIVTVLDAGDELKVLSNNEMDEPVFGTPALVGSQIYLRSLNAMWAFSAK
jgi:outer membrane protein assembly factor BamB